MSAPELLTPRLRLRRWRVEDREPFAVLNADQVAMEHFPSTLTRSESDELASRLDATFDGSKATGSGMFAVEVLGTGEFIGTVGLSSVGFDAHFTPAVEVAWRLSRSAWGFGYATEAAAAVMRDGFDRLQIPQIVSFTVPTNLRSIRVMEKLDMTHDATDDFDHPRLPTESRLRRHVLYRGTPSEAGGIRTDIAG
ncbi:MAG: GNAT family N-acetyltransferase [Microthrixaceae bacterium]